MLMRIKLFVFLFYLILVAFGLQSCATTGQAPTIYRFNQYGLDPGPSQTQTKSEIEINLKTIRISDMYDYPDLFSFNQDDLPPLYKGSPSLAALYPKGPSGKQWEFPFTTPDFAQQLLLAQVTIKNGTKHILRMMDARIFLVVEGQDPVKASRFDDLINFANYFEQENNKYLQQEGGILGGMIQLPEGFYRALVFYHRDSFKLINDLSSEILPGFTYKGLLVFPVVLTTSSKARISFFDITIKTDAAGNPVEKTQLDFPLQLQKFQMWFDRNEKIWKMETPPSGP